MIIKYISNHENPRRIFLKHRLISSPHTRKILKYGVIVFLCFCGILKSRTVPCGDSPQPSSRLLQSLKSSKHRKTARLMISKFI